MAAQIQLDTLPLPQLNSIKQQLDEEVASLQQAYTQLKLAQEKYSLAKDCLNSLGSSAESQAPMLIPLTESLFIPGKLSSENNKQVLVDIGTGFYAEKSTTDAMEYYQRKVQFVQQNLDSLQQTVQQKMNSRQTVEDVMRYKVMLAMEEQKKQQAESQLVSSK